MSALLLAKHLCLAHGTSVVLDDVTLNVTSESRIGVVGPNGVGKSTLLSILAGEVVPDSGTRTLAPATASVGYAHQERLAGTALLAGEALATLTGVARADAEMQAAAVALGGGSDGAGEAYADALEAWLALGGADFEARRAEVCEQVGLSAEVLARPCAALSGGESARLSLAVLALSRHDIVLLDEPTNDLDLNGLALLERFVTERAGGVVVVSHDRAFLEATITSVFELDEHSRTGTLFEGGWTAYLREREVAAGHAKEHYEQFKSQHEELEARARRQRDWANAGARKTAKKPSDGDKAQRDFRLNRTEKQASKVRITEKALSRLEVVDKPWEGWELDLSISAAPRSGDVVVRLEQAVVRRGDFVLGPIDLEVAWADRLAIIGANGSGKSTLIETILGRAPLASGSRYLGPGVVVGELDQSRADFEADETLLVGFARLLGSEMTQSEMRSLLAKLGLTATHLERAVATLSPGERTRATLALFMARGVNCLVLDEPTNHLDLPAIEQLESALNSFSGTVLLVTHDRRLLEHVPLTRTIELATGQLARR